MRQRVVTSSFTVTGFPSNDGDRSAARRDARAEIEADDPPLVLPSRKRHPCSTTTDDRRGFRGRRRSGLGSIALRPASG
jgi:hypothetical protein